MPQADFYVLPAADTAARPRFLCRLAEQIVPAGHRLHIHCEDRQAAEQLDQLLWNFKPESFVPHQLVGGRDDDCPVQIGWQAEQIDPQRVFINLTLAQPEQALKAERVVEIVVQTDEVLAVTRAAYKHYKDGGYEIRMNDMRRK
ncbi:DNA polymerase III subunit chi [Marinobacterium arenosum]|uniref:DNA polymerase III subunit chi n=1 Tax=Marinobacterium arenosum TaxID=2862496 RepID=UPI001C960F79|nr:DNA polymerase III subunit chi [Marinobacterium arenosum]MBY4678982.1 DNA polymerase III subunit chi [Marinobacterium arenosum]